MDIAQINSTILKGEFTNDQLTSILDAVKFARVQLTKQNKRKLHIGQRVQYNSPKQGRMVLGTVTKIAIKFVTVDCGINGRWRVPANMLEAV